MRLEKVLPLAAFLAACAPGQQSTAKKPPAADGRTAVNWEILSLAANVSGGPPVSTLDVPPMPALRSNSMHQSLALGLHHSCLLADSGDVYCWGAIGPEPALSPSRVEGLPKDDAPLQIAAGDAHACALLSSGAIWCWGLNTHGQLGVEPKTTPRSATAVRVEADGQVFSQLTAGGDQTCALDPRSTAWCWGSNTSGQLGDGTTTDSYVPLAVMSGGSPLAFGRITTSATHTCAAVGPGARDWGSVYCWGDDSSAQLGNVAAAKPIDGTKLYPSPVKVLQVVSAGRFALDGLTLVQQLASGPWFTCGATIYGNYYCWGDNSSDQLGVVSAPHGGNAALDWSNYPDMFTSLDFGDPAGSFGQVTVDGPVPYTSGSIAWSSPQIVAGASHVCVLPPDGRSARCWGANGAGQLGPAGPETMAPSQVPVSPARGAFSELAAGGDHTCGVSSDGEVYCWGDNSTGELGNGSIVSTATPQPVAGGPYFADVDGAPVPPLPSSKPVVDCQPDPNVGIAPNGGNLSSYRFYLGDVLAPGARVSEVDFFVTSDSATLANQLELTVYSVTGAAGVYHRLGAAQAANAFSTLGCCDLPPVRFVFDGGVVIPDHSPVVLQITQRAGVTLTIGSHPIANAGTPQCPVDPQEKWSIPLQIFAQ